MDEAQMRHMLAEATKDEPPLGAVVDRAVHAGIRVRRRRRIAAVAGSLAAVVVAALAPALSHAVASSSPPPMSPSRLAPGDKLYVPTQLGMLTVALPSGKVGPLLTDGSAQGNQYFLPYRNTVYDYDPGAGRLYSFNSTTGKAAKPITLPRSGYSAPMGTEPMVITPDGRTLYVPLDAVNRPGPGSVVAVDTATGVAGKPIPVGTDPGGMVMSPDGSTLYVLGSTGTLTAVKTATGTAGQPINLGLPDFAVKSGIFSNEPMAISPDGSTIYIPYWGTHSLIPVVTASGKVGRPITFSPQLDSPDEIVFSPDGTTGYVANLHSVVPLDLAAGRAGTPIPVQGGSYNTIKITPDGKTLYALGMELTPVNLVTGKAEKPVPAMGQPLHSMAMSPDGRTVYVSRDHAIVVVSAATNRQLRLIHVPPELYAYAIEFSK